MLTTKLQAMLTQVAESPISLLLLIMAEVGR